MKKISKKRCRHCRRLFIPDHRNRNRQKYCSEPNCQKASKSASQKKWLGKAENKNYFRGSANVERVREWRKKNSGYWKRRQHRSALQDSINAQHVEKTGDNEQIAAHALQDVLNSHPPVIVGLISNFIGSPLQDDIATTLLAMQQSGQDILSWQPQHKGGRSDCKNSYPKRPCPQNSR